MRKTKFTRLICLALAALFLVSGAVVSVGAASGTSAGYSVNDYQNVKDTMTYEEYVKRYVTSSVITPDETITIDATDGWTFVDRLGNTITMSDSTWTMTVRNADGTTTDYTSIEDAVAAGYDKSSLVYYTEEYDGVPAIYTPSVGSVTWTIDLSAYGITKPTRYSIELSYYPVEGKSASVEREFYINGEVPFSEARALNLAKIWSPFKADGKSALSATYVAGKGENLNTILAEAQAAGLECSIQKNSKNVDCLVVLKPEVMTVAKNAFISKYDLRFFTTDADSNELRPTMKQTPAWSTYALRDSYGYYPNPFGFVLSPDTNGEIRITLEGVNEPMALSEIRLKGYSELQSYNTYYEGIKKDVGIFNGKDVIKIEGEYTTNTSTNVVYPVEDRSSALTSPVDPKKTLLNTIGTEKWATAGQWVEYSFSVETSGMYDIYSRFMQSYLDGMYVSRALSVFTKEYADLADYKAKHNGSASGYYDGVPFLEASQLRYNYSTDWQMTNMTNGLDANKDGTKDSYQIYLEKGVVYTIRYEVTLGTMNDQIRKIESILNNLNESYLNIIKLTGSSPDDYRDYNFSRLLPETLITMIEEAERLEEVSKFLKETAGVASTYSGICDKLASLLDRLGRDEGEIAKNLDNLKSYVGSLGTMLTDAKTQPLQLDYLLIQPSTAAVPKAKANFFQLIWHEMCSFFWSFFRDYNSMGAMDDNTSDATINVWLAYGRDQAQVIRSICTNEFTPENKIAVDLKLVAGGTLLPSILAGMGPDVYIGMGQAEVINYAIRGALQNIEGMDGFDDVKSEFNEAAMIVLGTEDADGDMHYYGLPVTQGFSMMFVRQDVLQDLNVPIPTTWKDIYEAQTILKAHNMEIGLTTDYKMFLYQLGGELFADNGMRINLDSKLGLQAFETMCNMFTQYSFPYTYSAANRFRTGEMPIIISDYTGLYNHLKVFATELDGCWTFVPLPGYYDEEGNFNNCSISSASAEVMIAGSQKTKEAWKFMKWYAGPECQTEYAEEMVAIIGDSAKHATANATALQKLPWTADELSKIMEQFDNLASIPNYPGYYFIDRYTTFAFLSAYNDNADPKTELQSYINIINKEITRKREEFNLETLEIGQTLAKKRGMQAEQAIKALLELNATDKYTAAIAAAKYAIVNEKIPQLYEAAEMFDEILAKDWDGSKKTITKVNGEKLEVPSYYINVSKQTAKQNVTEEVLRGYDISKNLGEQTLVFFISQCLKDAAAAYSTY